MRDALALLEGARLTVTGTVVRYGCRPRFADLFEETLLLQDVRTHEGELLTDHLWMPMGTRLSAVDPQPGDVLSFTARVRPYVKQKLITRKNGRLVRLRAVLDYTLRYPSQICKIAPTHAEEGIQP